MAMSCPVVATTIGGMPEMLAGGAGELYAPRDVDALTEKLEMLLSSREKRRAIGEQARIVVERRFSLAAMLGQFKEQAFRSPPVSR